MCEEANGVLHKVSTMNVDANLKDCANKTSNFLPHALLVTGPTDAHAADYLYHSSCYTELRNAAAKVDRAAASASDTPNTPFDVMVTAQLVLYMSDSSQVFKLSQLQSLYKNKLIEPGRPCPILNPTRFKEHILKNLPADWYAFTKGRDVFLGNSDTVGEVLRQSHHQSIDQDEAMLLMKAAGMLRRHILTTQESFSGSFSDNCFTDTVPEPLLTFLKVPLQGSKANIESPSEMNVNDNVMHQRSKVACVIGQVIIYNTIKYGSPSQSTVQIRHSRERETPLPLYVGIKLHNDTRLKHLIGTFHHLGLGVSYDRIREVKLSVARSVCRQIEADGVVVPTNMKTGVFTTGDFDNLDHKKTSNLSNDEFHDTAITLTNHLSSDNMGVSRIPAKIDPTNTSKPKLPDHYVIVPPVNLSRADSFKPKIEDDNVVRPSHSRAPGSEIKETVWMNHVSQLLTKEELGNNDMATWSGYHSRMQDCSSLKPRAEIGILPLFPDKSTAPGLVKHVMLIVKQSIEFLNPGQTPVFGCDQPLFALAKQL